MRILPLCVLLAGALALCLPTLFDVARRSWSTEQGGAGPIVMLLAIWLIARERARVQLSARPGSPLLTGLMLVPVLVLYTLARITGTIEIEGLAMYLALVVGAYGYFGARALKHIWFPLLFMLFAFPPPDQLYAMITQPIKIMLSTASVAILYLLDYPVANSGVTIQIGQYQMLVAAACAGVNSLIGLSALGLFYSYIRHYTQPSYMLLLIAFILPIAVFVNLIRVLLLLLITYHFGEAAGQGFFHELAGLTMFALALLGIFALDSGLMHLFAQRSRKVS
jgi:exosortase